MDGWEVFILLFIEWFVISIDRKLDKLIFLFEELQNEIQKKIL